MRLILHGPTALAWWLTARTRPEARGATDSSVLQRGGVNVAGLAYLRERAPFLPMPHHVLTRVWNRPHPPGCRVHSSRRLYPRGSFVRIDHGILAACPELCLAQMAQALTRPQVVQIGSALCSAFALDPASRGGLARRRPLTDIARIESYLDRCPSVDGSRPLREALPLMTERAYSPPEIFMRMVLGMPTRLGGFGLAGSTANERLTPTQRAQRVAGRRTLVPDLCWPEEKLVVEYDSNAEHLTPIQLTQDATKRLALEADGYTVIAVTTSQLTSPASMELVAREIGRRLHRRLRIRTSNFRSRQAELYRLGWSLDEYLNRQWLNRQRAEARATNQREGMAVPPRRTTDETGRGSGEMADGKQHGDR